jgi:hypothetical protein
MPHSVQDALIQLMVVTAFSDTRLSALELGSINGLASRLPVFSGYERQRITAMANASSDLVNGPAGLEGALDRIVAAIPERLHDTAYALAVEVAVVDLDLPQEQLRLLEMIRDRLVVDRLVTAAIETSARARMRKG